MVIRAMPSWMMMAAVTLIVLVVIFGLIKLFSSERGQTLLKLLAAVPVIVLLLWLLGRVTLSHRVHTELPRRQAGSSPETDLALASAPDDATLELASEDADSTPAEISENAETDTGDASDKDAGDTAAAVSAEDPSKPADEADSAEEPSPPGSEEPSAEGAASAAEVPALAEPPASGPPWVGRADCKVGNTYQMSVSVGPYTTRAECDQKLPDRLQAAVDEYAAAYIGPEARGHVRLPLDYIRGEIVKEEWEQQRPHLMTPKGEIPETRKVMTTLHALLEFDQVVNARLEEEWDKVVVAQRIGGVGTLAGAVLLLLAGVYGYLRIDLATGGRYRGRLRLAAATAILVLIAAGLMWARWMALPVEIPFVDRF